MKAKRITAAAAAMALVTAFAFPVNAYEELTQTENANKFDIGSDEVGGSGVEDSKCWIKVVQSSNNDLKLFDDVGPDVNVSALAVTIEISEWSGTDFSVSWGANIDFIGDSATTWCGTDKFNGISQYTISSEGEYTLVCDLSELCDSLGKEGIANMQTCEMVIGDVEEGDSTVIEVKSARIYVDGEQPEEAVIPGDNAADEQETQDDNTEDTEDASSEEDTVNDSDPAEKDNNSSNDETNEESEDDESTEDISSDTEDVEQGADEDSTTSDNNTESNDNNSENSMTTQSNKSTDNSRNSNTSNENSSIKTDDSLMTNSNAQTGIKENIPLALIALAGTGIIVSRKKR